MILVAGGGIGGLAAALALARVGHDVEVLERGSTFATAGAGIQLGPNAVKVLRTLGVAEAVAQRASAPASLVVYKGATGRCLTRMPLGQAIADRCGAPYWTLHRADLLSALADAVAATSAIKVTFDFDFVSVSAQGNSVSVTSADGKVHSGAALIGADGVWSRVRSAVAPNFHPAPSGYCAYRTLLPVACSGDLATDVVGAWLSANAHVIHYPVQAGAALNIVVIVRDAWTSSSWDAPADAAEIRGKTAAFAEPLCAALAAANVWHKWSLPDPLALPAWNAGPMALLGDAAHAMLPFFAQGAAMALEDAAALATAVASHGADLSTAFGVYHATRHARVARVQHASVTNGRIFHLSGPAAFARDAVMTMVPGSALLSRYDWLYAA